MRRNEVTITHTLAAEIEERKGQDRKIEKEDYQSIIVSFCVSVILAVVVMFSPLIVSVCVAG